jgi:prevent-host-death family protein
MRVVNTKELKAKLSGYLREVQRGETFLVTQRDTVVARLAPAAQMDEVPLADGVLARLVALGARPPIRPRRRGPPRRTGPGAGLTTAQIDALLDGVREESR